MLSSALYSFRLNIGIPGCQHAFQYLFSQEQGSWNIAEPALSAPTCCSSGALSTDVQGFVQDLYTEGTAGLH